MKISNIYIYIYIFVVFRVTAASIKDGEWTPKSRRTGVIAIKLGMSQIWDTLGRRIPVTLLQVNGWD